MAALLLPLLGLTAYAADRPKRNGPWVISPEQARVMALSNRLTDALAIGRYCDTDLPEVLAVLRDTARARRELVQALDLAHGDVLAVYAREVDRLRGAAPAGGAAGSVAAEEALKVGLALLSDALEATTDFLFERYSELAAAATAARGVQRGYRAAKSAKTAYELGGTVSALSRGAPGAGGAPAGWRRAAQLLLRMSRLEAELVALDRFEATLWRELRSRRPAADEVSFHCRREGRGTYPAAADRRMAELLTAARHRAQGQQVLRATNPMRPANLARRFGLRALGEELGFSSDPDDPLGIQRFVVPELRKRGWVELRARIDAAAAFAEAVARDLGRPGACRPCGALVALEAAHRAHLRLRQVEALVRKRLAAGNRELMHLFRLLAHELSPDAIQSAQGHPLYVATATALSLTVPWTGTAMAAGEAGYNVLAAWMRSAESGELRARIKKANFHVVLYDDLHEALRRARAALDAAVRGHLEALTRACERPACSDEGLRLALPEGATLRAELVRPFDVSRLEGCWEEQGLLGMPVMLGQGPAGRQAGELLRLAVDGDGKASILTQRGERVPLEGPRQERGYIRYTHRYTVESYRRLWGVSAEHAAEAIRQGERRLLLDVRPYETRGGDITLLAMRLADPRAASHEVGGRTGRLWGRAQPGGRPRVEVVDAGGRPVREIGRDQAVSIRATFGDKGCGVGRRFVYAKLSPAMEPTAGTWLRLTETAPGSGVFQSRPWTIDFFEPGERRRTVLVHVPVAHGVQALSARGFDVLAADRRLEVSGAGGLRPVRPGSERALAYGAASVLSPLADHFEALTHALADPFFRIHVMPPIELLDPSPAGPAPGGGTFAAPGAPHMRGPFWTNIKPVARPELEVLPVRVPFDLAALASRDPFARDMHAGAKLDRANRARWERLARRPDWADPRVRQKLILEHLLAGTRAYLRTLGRASGAAASSASALRPTLRRLEAEFARRLRALEADLARRPFAGARKQARQGPEVDPSELARRIRVLREAYEAYRQAGRRWLAVSDLIDRQRERGHPVDDLRAELRRRMKALNEARDRYVALEREWGRLRELESRRKALAAGGP